MDKIVHQLGELVLTALPTFLLLIFLTLYLKSIFFAAAGKSAAAALRRYRRRAQIGGRKHAARRGENGRIRSHPAARRAAKSIRRKSRRLKNCRIAPPPRLPKPRHAPMKPFATPNGNWPRTWKRPRRLYRKIAMRWRTRSRIPSCAGGRREAAHRHYAAGPRTSGGRFVRTAEGQAKRPRPASPRSPKPFSFGSISPFWPALAI